MAPLLTFMIARILACLAVAVVPLVAQTPALPTPLIQGDRRSAALRGGEIHHYTVDLDAGEFLGVTIVQNGIDVVPEIVDPGDRKVFRLDRGAYGPEFVAFLAPAGGTYRLQIGALERTSPPGQYEMAADAVRAPTSIDLQRAEAMTLETSAYALVGKFDEPSAKQALAGYERALDLWRAAGDRWGEAQALTALAFITSERLDDPRAAGAYGEQELTVRRAIGDDYGEARALRNAGVRASALGDADGALQAYTGALALHRAAGRVAPTIVALESIATNLRASGELERAGGALSEALRLARQHGDRAIEADVTATQCALYLSLGENEAAVRSCQRVLTLAPDDQYLRALASDRLGLAFGRLQEWDRAVPLLEEALRIWEARNWRAGQARVLRDLGDVLMAKGDPDAARRAAERAVELSGASGDTPGQTDARVLLGRSLVSLNRLDEAASVFAGARQGAWTPTRPLAVAGAAEVAMRQGALDDARSLAEEAVTLAESARGRATSQRVRSALLSFTQSHYETLIDILFRQHERQPDAGHAARALEVSEAARARSLLEVLNEGAATVGADGSTALVEEERRVLGRLRAKAAALATPGLSANRADALERELVELSDQADELATRMRRESPRAASLIHPRPLTAPQIQTLADTDTVILEFALGDSRSWAWAVTPTEIVSAILPPRHAIEASARTIAELSASRAIQATAARPAALADADRRLTDELTRLGQMLLGPFASRLQQDWRDKRLAIVPAGALEYVPFAALIEPAGPPVPAEPRAVSARQQRLQAAHEIVTLPSASVLGVLRQLASGRERAVKAAVVFADPVFVESDPRVRVGRGLRPAASTTTTTGSADEEEPEQPITRAISRLKGRSPVLTRLPFSREEAREIETLASPGSVFRATDFDASRATVLETPLADYRIAHFATHGLIDAERPELSGLVLSMVDAAGRSQDGFLRLDDIYRLRLRADLVVLSACRTALGRAIRGEGLVGLTRGFMFAGAPRVVASLWQVDDLATAELMKRFYKGLLTDRLAPAAALHRAQREIAAIPRWSSPYYWAAFVLQGDWRESGG